MAAAFPCCFTPSTSLTVLVMFHAFRLPQPLKYLGYGLLGLALPFLLLSACGPTPASTETLSASPASSAVGGPKIAIVLSGPANDDSWNEAALKAAESLKQDGVEVSISESVDVPDAERVLRQYAEAGYTVIVAHSFNYQDAVFKVAKEFPNVNFAWGGGIGKTGENVADYDQPFYEGAYLVGQLAGNLSQSGKLGALYGFDIPVCKAMGKALLAGAKTMRPDATLTDTAVGDWMDVSKAKEAALAQAETGVDYWISCGQGPALGAIEAARAKTGFTTGYVGDMTALGPDVVAASIVWNMQPMFRQMLKDTEQKAFANKYYRLGIADDVIQVAVNPKFQSQLGDKKLKQLDQTRTELTTGKFKVPFETK